MISSRSSRGGAVRPNNSPSRTASEASGGRRVQSSMMSTKKLVRGMRLVSAATPRSTGFATRSVTRIGRKITPAATSALSSTGISMNRPRATRGCRAAISSAVFAPSEVPPTIGPVDSEVIDERRHLVGERAHAVGPHVGRLVGGAVPEQVDRDHAEAPRRHLGRQVVVHVPVHQQAVDEHEHPLALPPVGVRDPAAVVAERALDRRHRGRVSSVGADAAANARPRLAPTGATPVGPRAPRASPGRG